ncbi:MAG: AAA family ATPase [Cytophagales bacterium]|nr:AAA family ATPase [Cytophaga sp.]
MIKAFVFGKFLPFHKGHEAMIRFALAQCDFLSVLVCCSDQEHIPSSVRKSWIEETFNGYTNLEVKALDYVESELPNSSESSRSISAIWSELFKKEFPDYSLLVTSEPYGDYIAEYMHIKHIAFDLTRHQFPVSASLIRKNVFDYWGFLPDSVKPYYAIKIVVLGTECTGKTMLAEKLAGYYSCSLVSEAGRDLISNSKKFSMDDLYSVAIEHAKRIQSAYTEASPVIVIDTDIHVTESYARYCFHTTLQPENSVYDTNKADLYLYLENDVPYIQDGTRLEETERNHLDLSHRQVLKEHGVDLVEIKGTWEERFLSSLRHIDALIEKKSNRYQQS